MLIPLRALVGVIFSRGSAEESPVYYLNHIPSKTSHAIDTGYVVTWRQAAVHWGESGIGSKAFSVAGHHFLSDYAGGQFPFESTYVDDCSIYDGWWDFN